MIIADAELRLLDPGTRLGPYTIVELVAVGNGTASREADKLVRDALRDLPAERRPTTVMVNEAGASVYSASKRAREEFPDQDITVRGAISIARRLQDPLAELVKIEPKGS